LAAPDEQRRVVSKTPSMDNLDLVDRLFPDARLILLIRDGRAVVESGMKSFNWTFEAATRRWADAARNLARFDEAHRGTGLRYRILRYEDLYSQPEVELPRLHDFLGLAPTAAKLADLADIPVRGSSVKGEAARVHWAAVAKPAGFNPLERFSHWSPAQHARFNWLAGDAMALFGYDLALPAGAAAYWRARNRWLDLRQTWRSRGQRLWRRLTRGPGG
jgi:hypothetical protein